MLAHGAFDPLWRGGPLTRNKAYKLLADAMKISRKECHIKQMSTETARRVPEAVEQIKKAIA